MEAFETFLKESQKFSLTKEEAELLYKYAKQKYIPTPSRLLVNKKLFIDNFANNHLFNNILKKLGFYENHLIENTQHLVKGVEAKAYLNHTEHIPLLLHKKEKNYTLWQILLHAKRQKLLKSASLKIIFSIAPFTYELKTSSFEIFNHYEPWLLKIPHKKLTILTNRPPRLEEKIEVVIKNQIYNIKAHFFNISSYGARLFCAKHSFAVGDKLHITFHINKRAIDVQAKVLYKMGHNEYGIYFQKIDHKEVLEHYIQKRLCSL